MSKEQLYALMEDIEEKTGERAFELERAINHQGFSDDPERDVLDALASIGF